MTDYREPDYRLLKSELGKRLYAAIYDGIPIRSDFLKGIPPPPRRFPESKTALPVVSRVKYAVPADYVPSLTILVHFYQDFGVVDEEKISILQTLAMTHGLHVGIEGPSGSGKSYLVQGLVELLPKEQVYSLELASDKAVFYDTARLNRARFIIVPELQKPLKDRNGSTIEVVKTLTEGRDLDRLVARAQGPVTHQKISGKDKVLLYTLATENSFKKDAELSRRFIVLYTDTSQEHVQHVLAETAHRRFAGQKKCLSDADIRTLKCYLASLIDLQDVVIRDPFTLFMRQHIPQIPKAISVINHYDHLLHALTKFYHPRRVRDGRNVFTALEDQYQLFLLYHANFLQNLQDVAPEVVIPPAPEVDWESCFKSGLEAMARQYPQQLNTWLDRQIVDNKLVVHHPLTGESLTVVS